LSLVLGAKRRGHLVRQYEKIRNAVTPMVEESIICVDNQGPWYVKVGGEPGGGPPGSSNEVGM
jgi:hypothetical protein